MSDVVDVAIIGELAALVVETDQPMQDNVVVTFDCNISDGGSGETTVSFDDNGQVTRIFPDPNSTKLTYLMSWKARFTGTDAQLESGPVVRFTMKGTGTAGQKIVGVSKNLITLRKPITVTDKPELTRIMLHEFATGGATPNDPTLFFPGPLERYLGSLSLAQKKLLLNYPVASGGNRLVVFITLYPPTSKRLMGADHKNEDSVHANASFAVFHCQTPGKPVKLVCYTEHFLVNNIENRETKELLVSSQGGIPASQWQFKGTNKPVMFKIAAMKPDFEFMSGVVWHRIFTATGQDVMKGNTMHGMINTHGCWMLFRNFNWPQSKFRDMDQIYRKVFRPMRERPRFDTLRAKLSPTGYDAAASAGLSSSLEKFLNFDRNYAYLWFQHDIVGIKYFSDGFTGWGAFPGDKAEGKVTFVNEHKTDGMVFEKQFPLSKVLTKASTASAEEGNFMFYDPEERRKSDKNFHASDSLWRNNVLGFKTTSQFAIETTGRFGNMSKAQIDACSWADLYIYSDDTTPPGGLP